MSHCTKSYNLAELESLHQASGRLASPLSIGAFKSSRFNVKLHSDPRPFYNTFTAYGEGYVEVNEVRYTHSIIVQPEGEVVAWPVSSFEALTESSFEPLLVLAPEIVIFGSGQKLRFPHPRLLRGLSALNIGIETMDLFAACRTYNILMSEGRKVAAALLIEAHGVTT
jgi:uncharacterized protein